MKVINRTTGRPMENITESLKQKIEIGFYRNNATCNVPEPPENCLLSNVLATEFDPLKMLLAGKCNLRIKLKSTNVTLYFINVDLLASGPPDAQLPEKAINESSEPTAMEQAWRFGSLAPKIYEYVWVGIPYNESVNESWDFEVKIPYLYDENWNLIWNVTINGTNVTLDEYADYPKEWFEGMECSKVDSTANCFVNLTSNYFWLKIPHFSGIESVITGNGTTVEGSYSNASVETKANEVTVITANTTSTTNISLGIVTTENATGSITITEYNETSASPPSGYSVLNKYVKIEVSPKITENLSWAWLNISYTDAEVQAAGVDESTLKIYYWNETTQTWEYQKPGWPYVEAQGVNTVDNYVWANVTGFSLFGLFGKSPAAEEEEAEGVGGIDVTPPTITIISPLNETYNVSSIWANVSLSEIGKWCGYSLDSAPNVTMLGSGKRWYKLITNLTNGLHSIQFFCNDSFGNMGVSALRYFTVKVTVPQNITPVTPKKCPTCPPCTEWSECINGKQTRTCYVCNETTNYECVAYTETRDCIIPQPSTIDLISSYSPYIFACIVIVIVIFIIRKLKK